MLKRKQEEFYKMKYAGELFEGEIIAKLFENIENETLFGSNNILVYMGTFITKDDYSCDWNEINEILVYKFDSSASYYKYKDLETGNIYRVDISNVEEFVKNNLIVEIPNARRFETKEGYEDDFLKLRRIFCCELVKNGQEKAIQKVTLKESLDELFSVANYMLKHNIDLQYYKVYNEVAICNIERELAKSKSRLRKVKNR